MLSHVLQNGATLIYKACGHQKELGVSSIQDKVRDMRLGWYGHMQRMEENEVRVISDM